MTTNKSSISNEQLPYRILSASLPKQPDHREDNAKVQQVSAVPANTTLNQTQDASVEARISLDLGKEAMTQKDDNDNVPLAEAEEPKATCKSQIDESSSQKTYDERLKSLSKELAETRLLFERACSD